MELNKAGGLLMARLSRGEKFFFRLWVLCAVLWVLTVSAFIPVFYKPTQEISQVQQRERDPKCDEYQNGPPGSAASALWTLGNCDINPFTKFVEQDSRAVGKLCCADAPRLTASAVS